MEKKVLNFKRIIVPTRVIYKNSIRLITRINLDFVVNGYSVYLDEESRLEKVIINGRHPNSDPNTNEFCISEPFKNMFKITKSYRRRLENMIATFNMNDCYFSPWYAFSYDKDFSE